MKSWRVILIVVPWVVAGCIPEIDDDLSTISAPRILAVQSQPAEAGPEKLVTTRALVAAPDGAKVPFIDWELCIDRKPLTELGPVSPACLSRTGNAAIQVPLGSGDSVGPFEIPRDACSLFGPTPPPPKANEPGGRPTDPDVTGGYYEPLVAFLGSSDKTLGMVRLDCGLPVGVPRDALKDYNARHRPNENPAIDAFSMGTAAPLTDIPPDDGSSSPEVVSPHEHLTVRATYAACPRTPVCGDGQCSAGETKDQDSCPADCPDDTAKGCTGAETYAWYDGTSHTVVDRREGIAVSFYSTDGAIDDRRTGVAATDPDQSHVETGWTAPGRAGDVVLWAVIRDDRGGVSWQRYRLRVK